VLAQTPQIFDAALLRRAYASANLVGTTDDASVVEQLGETVVVVEGDSRNLKITTQDDLALARAIMGIKSSSSSQSSSYRFE
jgi:2-C-methyl-D-erythritol 4-phosphate cytidylyltransferase